jgi:hypothetical protein
MLKFNHLLVRGPSDQIRSFVEKAGSGADFTLAPWIGEDIEDEERPDDFGEPETTLLSDTEWAASWDSKWSCFSETMFAVAYAYEGLSFDYSFCEQEGEPRFAWYRFSKGECYDSKTTEYPAEAREWSSWFEHEADEWEARLDGDT